MKKSLDNTTIVYLTPEQVALFILFQEHYNNIAFLLSKDVFKLKNSNVILSFDSNSQIKTIKKEIFEYRDKLSTL